jgi:outer membrane protein OmpA-like peptidoglycan-associated protein/tetratricopeptide (TPR) repeat protein
MRKILFISVIFFIGLSSVSIGMITGDDTLSQINKFMSDRKFSEAVPLLKEIIEKDPSNSDANFKLGLCYYFSADKRNLSLEYFRRAMANINQKYKFNDPKTNTAPIDIYFFLGEAYLNNFLPDSALYCYIKYKNTIKQESPFNLDSRINWCVNALKEMSSPLNVNIENLGNNINTKYFEKHPVVTLDNSVIFFSSTRPVMNSNGNVQTDTLTEGNNEDIYYAIKMPSGKWSKSVYFEYNTLKNEFPACLSVDGRMLILSREERGNYDLFYSIFENGKWTEPVFMGNSINSSADEKEASLSEDGNNLYFTSNRDGGYGKFDIYESRRSANGKWGKPVNLGKDINTSENEISPFIHPDGQVLYFSSDGYNEESMGGYDIFYSTKNTNDTWSMPLHIKYPVNTTRDDVDYQVTSGGKRYYTSLTDFNSFDLVEITGKQDDVADINSGVGTTSLSSELNVMEVMEVEKKVEKEVQVSDIVEVKTEVEKEVPLVETVEVEKKDGPKDYSLESVNLDEIDSLQREALIKKVKDYYSKSIGADKSVIFKTIYFSFNSAELLMLSKNELRVLVEYLNENPTIKVEVIGHTDILGDWDVNLNVSRGRAQSVYNFLLENNIAHNRIIYYGKGSAAPIASNSTIEGRSKNRRVEILLLR